MEPRLSIIIPVFRDANGLANCLESVAACLTHAPGLEVVVQDGGGDAETATAAAAFAGRIPGLRIASRPDQGVYDAMNMAMDRATGRWLLFLGTDDRIVAPEVLPRLLDAADAAQADILQADVAMGHTGERRTRTITPARMFAVEGFCHQAFLYRRDFVGALRYDLRYPVCADGAFNLELVVARRARVAAVHEVLVRYAGTGLSSRMADPAWRRDRKTALRRVFPRRAFWLKAIVSPVRECLRKRGDSAATGRFVDRVYGFLNHP